MQRANDDADAPRRREEQQPPPEDGGPAVEEEAEGDQADPFAEPIMLSPRDASRMQLTETEHQWAVAIKQAIQQDPELNDFCDFDIAQIALLDRDNVEAALDRAFKLQAFRQEYDIAETVAHGKRLLQQLLDLFPGHLLSLSWSPPLNSFVVALDTTKVPKEKLTRSDAAVKIWLGGGYYLSHALSPDFEAIREGLVLLAECGGFSWTEHLDLRLYKKYFLELGSVYPMKMKKVRNFHTTLFWNILQSMVKPFMPEDVTDALDIGCVSLLGRLDLVYLTPNLEAANARFLARATESIRVRYENAKAFKL